MLRDLDWQISTDVSEKQNISIFRTGESKNADFSEDENLYIITVIFHI